MDSYIAKIDKDISTDSAELSREKKAATPVHEVKITKSGLRVVSAAPAPIPAITAQTSATERQKILDDSARQKIQAVAHHLQQAPAAKVTSKDRFQAASDSVAADLSAAEEAIDSLDAFTGQLPTSAAAYQQAGKASSAASKAIAAAGTPSTLKVSSTDARADDHGAAGTDAGGAAAGAATT